MTTKIGIQEQIQKLNEQLFFNTKESKKIELEIEIDRIARTILESPLESDDQNEMLTQLLRIRTRLIDHIPVNGIKESCLFLNTIQDVLPATICPAYNKMSFPTVSSYHTIASNISCIRLDPKVIEYIPKTVLEKVGPLEGKEVDLLWTAIDGRFYMPRIDRPLNNTTHAWAHHHALPGPEKITVNGKEIHNTDSNISFDVNMGIFPEIGLEKSGELAAIAFNRTSPMNVHIHARGNLKQVSPQQMLFSPDNAHFNVIPGSPFSVDWSIMQKGNRIAITKRLIIFDYEHPICAALIKSIRNCDDLATHLIRLEKVPKAIEETFSPVIEALKNNDPDAMELFHQLPLAFQYGIYREAWVSFDSPQGIHNDFGKASFEKDKSLDVKYHCNHLQCAETISRFSDRLENLLVGSQFDLLFKSQSLVKGDNVLTMMKCAQLFYKEKESKNALATFEQLPEKEREAVLYAFWELSGCPRVHKFSNIEFPLNCEREKQSRAEAILLAASRQPHRFEKPIVENHSKEEILLDLPVASSGTFEMLNRTTHDSLSTHHSQMPAKEQVSGNREQVSEEIITLAFDPNFQSLENSVKAERVNKILLSLEKNVRNEIYNKVYHHSQDSKKGGPSWGECHVADDMDVLINSMQEAFGA